MSKHPPPAAAACAARPWPGMDQSALPSYTIPFGCVAIEWCGHKNDLPHPLSTTSGVQAMRPRPGRIACLTFLTLFLVPTAASPDFVQCLAKFKELNTTVGGTDYDGIPVTNPLDAVGLTYTACVQYCSPKQEPFDWTRFSQQFSAWLIPWLALVSQLPFGAKSRLDNFISGELPCRVHCANFLIAISQSPSPLGPPPSRRSRSLLQPSTLAGPTTVSQTSSTPTTGALPRPLSTSNRFHSV